MNRFYAAGFFGLLFCGVEFGATLFAQQAAVQAAPADVPRLIPFSGTALDSAGKPVTTPAEITFALYKEEQGGPQLWIEIQKVHPDATGHYSVLLGLANGSGVPQDAFSSAEARWIGATVNGGVELPRVMLLSVPYALKAGDAETLGGLPASAFLQATSQTVQRAAGSSSKTPSSGAAATPLDVVPVSGSGTAPYLPVWTSPSTLGNSTIYQSGANIGIGRTVLEGDGISPINVKAFGAKGDGVTDDTAAIAAAIAAIPPTGGQLFFPAGKYITAGGFTLPYPTDVVGVGQSSWAQNQYGSEIVSTSPTAVLFTVTSQVGSFRNLGLTGTAASPTAGAGIFTNSAYHLARINIDSISVYGFYDDIHQGVGSSWSIRASHIQNPVRYGIYVQNTVSADDGDWLIEGNYIEGGALTSTTTSAAINIESSGGGKIAHNKINATYAWGIRMNVSGSVQTLINDNDIENVTGPPINIVQGWPYITIIGNFLNARGTNPCILANNLDGFFIGSNLLETNSPTSVPYAIVITNSQLGTIAQNTVNNHFAAPTSIQGYNITDLSVTGAGGLSLSGPATITGSNPGTLAGLTIDNTAGSGSSGINFEDVWQGVTYTGSIASSWYGNGMTFTLPRNFVGKGFFFNNNSGRTLMYIDSGNGRITTTNNTLDDSTGNMNIPAGKAYEVNGASIVPLAATSGSIGGSALAAGSCASAPVTVPGATTSMVAVASPVSYPGAAFQWTAYVSAANTVTVSVCTNLAAGGTPTVSAYNVRVIR